jgi:predicted enzyme related to lactoylglutathione lyase
MSEPVHDEVGSIGWLDLTVEHAAETRDFYRAVVGWTSAAVDMGGYDDWVMNTPSSGMAVSGICHARGANAGLPAQWLVYVTVASLDRSLARCAELGGTLLTPVRDMGLHGRFAVIRDPAGAVMALREVRG